MTKQTSSSSSSQNAHEPSSVVSQPSDDLGEINQSDGYDPHIIPAETAARKDREGNSFKHLPEQSAEPDSIDIVGGFRVDKEGLIDNFAIEPEMYYETPGDIPDGKDELLKQAHKQV